MNAPLPRDLTRSHDGRSEGLSLGCDSPFGRLPVGKFPIFEYGMREVRRAGEVISGDCVWTPNSEYKIREAFNVANNWRESHAYPMSSVHLSLKYYVRAAGMPGFTSARLKRMQAIRNKLKRQGFSIEMNQLQDLAGCRVILDTVDDVRLLVRLFSDRTRHTLRPPSDYISNPKPDGYRSYHVMLSYKGRGEAAVFNKRRVEIQVRTRLQHAWATAVEGVGTSLGEDFKGGRGNPDWRRLFRLVSAEFAMLEGCPEGDGLSAHNERVQELREIDRKIGALEYLENQGSIVQYLKSVSGNVDAPYYLVNYDIAARTVEVLPYFFPKAAVYGYEKVESFDNLNKVPKRNVVLVEAGKVINLLRAFPNYFGDVTIFKEHLTEILNGAVPKQYRIKLPPTPLPPTEQKIDLSWLRRSRFRPPRGA